MPALVTYRVYALLRASTHPTVDHDMFATILSEGTMLTVVDDAVNATGTGNSRIPALCRGRLIYVSREELKSKCSAQPYNSYNPSR